MNRSSSAKATIASNRGAMGVAGHAVERRVEEDVLAAREIRTEARSQLEKRGDAAGGRHRPVIRFEDAGDDLQQRALTASVRSNQPERLAAWNLQRDVAQSPESLACVSATQGAHRPLFQARRLSGKREGLGDAVDGDRWRRRHRASVLASARGLKG
jgi:hypothetical protein